MKNISTLFLVLAGIFLGITIFVAGMIVGNRLPRPADHVLSSTVSPTNSDPVQPVPSQKSEMKKPEEPITEKALENGASFDRKQLVKPAVNAKPFVIVTTKGNSLNVRQTPSVLSPVVSKLTNGSKVPLIEPASNRDRNVNWFQVEYSKEKYGWISRSFAIRVNIKAKPDESTKPLNPAQELNESTKIYKSKAQAQTKFKKTAPMTEVGNKETLLTKTLKGESGDFLKPSPPNSKNKQPNTLANETSELPRLAKGKTAGKDNEAKTPLIYSIEVGSFLDRKEAEELVTGLKSKNHKAYILSAWDAQGISWFTVRIGHFKNLDKALKAALELKQKERLMVSIQGMGPLGLVDIHQIPKLKTAPKENVDGMIKAKTVTKKNGRVFLE